MARIAFIGLGVMGFPMAGHLATAGHDVSVFNRSAQKAQAWAQRYPGRVAATVASAAEGAEFVFSCVGADADVAAVAPLALASMRPGGVFVDHTTTSATLARALSKEAQDVGRYFVDAPVSGGQAGAEGARLTVMAGGDAEVFARAQPVMAAYAANMTLIGGSGAGQLAKMVNQICIAGIIQGLAEGLHFAERAGIDPERVIAAISKGAAQSWQMENRWRTMTEGSFDFGFAVDWMRKDLGLVLEEAGANGSDLPVAALVDAFYAEVQASGGGRWDTSSLITRLRARVGGAA
ncbi:MAG: NAD(P)-dependent oxidoreductase [Hyphomonadaceae bacterium]|nr:NAD(P)-dependent oxidoreductase [Hyphomonadaceae bacterium]